MTFGKKLRILRTRRGLSQTELATLCGLSRRTVTSYESDVSKPGSKHHYEQLANALGVNVSALLEAESTEAPEQAEAERILGLDSAPEASPDTSYEISTFLRTARDIFADNRLTEHSKDLLMHTLQEIYWEVKKECFKGRDEEQLALLQSREENDPAEDPAPVEETSDTTLENE